MEYRQGSPDDWRGTQYFDALRSKKTIDVPVTVLINSLRQPEASVTDSTFR